MSQNQPTLQALILANAYATADAADILKGNAPFRGALELVTQYGYESGSPEWFLYVSSFVAALPKSIPVDANGYYVAA
jgi:hypothetical protein